jgi:hypothetical protein
MGTENDRWLTLQTTSHNALANSNGSGRCDPATAAFLAGRLFGCYRAGEASDPETFVAVATATLCGYPEMIVRRVCYGLPSHAKWLPSIAELRQACEDAMRPVWEADRRQAQREATRKVLAAPEGPRVSRTKWDALSADLPGAVSRETEANPDQRLAAVLAEWAARPPPTLSEVALRTCGLAAPPEPSEAWPGPPEPSWAGADDADDVDFA